MRLNREDLVLLCRKVMGALCVNKAEKNPLNLLRIMPAKEITTVVLRFRLLQSRAGNKRASQTQFLSTARERMASMAKSLENIVSAAIVSSFYQKLLDNLVVDVAVVGGGPSGLVAAKTLAERGYKTVVFERKLAPGGGVWGGGALFNEVVVQSEAKSILDEFGINSTEIADAPGYFSLDSVELASGLIFGALKAGAKIFNNVSVEDVAFKDDRINGLVINWTPVTRLQMHVDPLVVITNAVLDGTGHPCEVLNLVQRKARVKLDTPTGEILGERPMQAATGEITTVENTREYYPGIFASGMSANNVMGGYRMGPIFGGMLLSGKRAADLIEKSLKK